MDEQAKIALVKRFYEGWSRLEDFHTVMRLVHPDAEVDWTESRSPFRGTYRGLAQLEELWGEFEDAWDDFRVEIEAIHPAGGGRLVASTRVTGRGKGSGVAVDARGAVLWAFRDGKIAGAKLFQTAEEALSAAR
jgi:ketosteroid isomerase-like protein